MKQNVFANQARNLREKKRVDNIFGKFLVEKGLYDKIEITKDNIDELADFIGGNVKINVYCRECKESRVFSCEPISILLNRQGELVKESLEEQIIIWQDLQKEHVPRLAGESEEPWTWIQSFFREDVSVMVFCFHCAMDDTHRINYVVLTEGNTMIKIGQHPSFADLSSPELKKYRKVMSDDDEKELRRANGLYSAGIGIGSLVYLRRIFERMIDRASKKAINDGEITSDQYENARVNERIKMLSNYLPKVLVDNKVSYGIISKGIHELSEEECIEYFPVIRSFIMMILRHLEKMREDEEEEKRISASLSKIATKVN